MKTLWLAIVAAISGYCIGFVGGMLLIENLSSNTHDKSLEAAMTGAFVSGPLMAITGVIVVLVYHYRGRSQ
jgi:predicted permease